MDPYASLRVDAAAARASTRPLRSSIAAGRGPATAIAEPGRDHARLTTFTALTARIDALAGTLLRGRGAARPPGGAAGAAGARADGGGVRLLARRGSDRRRRHRAGLAPDGRGACAAPTRTIWSACRQQSRPPPHCGYQADASSSATGQGRPSIAGRVDDPIGQARKIVRDCNGCLTPSNAHDLQRDAQRIDRQRRGGGPVHLGRDRAAQGSCLPPLPAPRSARARPDPLRHHSGRSPGRRVRAVRAVWAGAGHRRRRATDGRHPTGHPDRRRAR